MAKSFFISEKETEEWLAMETRSITMPDGTQRPFTGMKLMWESFDFIIAHSRFSGPRLVGLAILQSHEMKRPFDDCFPSLLAYIHSEIEARQH